ncbi:MAG: GNAT family N-acetyltransferase [Bacteroides sp.]|nr:GNAT family N-acetyltransferase [Bacteroides sp.]
MEKRKEDIKRLWQLCFHDSEAFMELYFRRCYREGNTLSTEAGGHTIAAMQLLDYPMTFCGREMVSRYLSGLCTHPDAQGQGVMSRLIGQALRLMREQETTIATLIPAEPWLFDYYARFGFSTVFGKQEEWWESSAAFCKNEGTFSVTRCEETAERERVGLYIYKVESRLACCLLHTPEHWATLCEDLRISGGELYALHQNGRIYGAAVLYPEMESGWRVEECLADNDCLRTALLNVVCREKGISRLRVQRPASLQEPATLPFGMARIIHLPHLLQHYASLHPDSRFTLHITDPLLPENSGHYHLANGQCHRLPDSTAPSTDISRLTRQLFLPQQPHMTMMMN